MLYGTYAADKAESQIYAEAGLLSAALFYNSTRNIVFPGYASTANSSYRGFELLPHFEAGYDWNLDFGTVELFAAMECAMLFQEGYAESGAVVLNMNVASSHSFFLRTEFGIAGYESWRFHWGRFILKESISCVNKQPFGLGTMDAYLVGFPPGFTAEFLLGAPPAFSLSGFTESQTLFSPSIDFFFRTNNDLFFSLFYQGEFGSGYIGNQLLAKCGIYF